MEANNKGLTQEACTNKAENGIITVNQFTLHYSIGSGSFGTVKKCTRNGESFAMKVYKKNLLRRRRDFLRSKGGQIVVKTALDDVYKEIQILNHLAHPNVVCLLEALENSEKVYLVLDYCSEGSLMDWDAEANRFISNKVLTETQLRTCVRGMIQGLEYIHASHVVHRDIKPQNIFLTEDLQVKIGDFGQAQTFEDTDRVTGSVGTYHFFAPEMCESDAYSGKAADVWALGLTIYALMFQKLPFSGEGLLDLFDAIQEFELEFPKSIDPDLQTLIERMLDKNPETRITLDEALQNKWLNEDSVPLRRSQKRKTGKLMCKQRQPGQMISNR